MDIPRRDRHCKREDVPKTALPFGRKFAIAGCISREKVGYGRGAKALKRKSGELHDPSAPPCLRRSVLPMGRRKRAVSSQAGFGTDRQLILGSGIGLAFCILEALVVVPFWHSGIQNRRLPLRKLGGFSLCLASDQ